MIILGLILLQPDLFPRPDAIDRPCAMLWNHVCEGRAWTISCIDPDCHVIGLCARVLREEPRRR